MGCDKCAFHTKIKVKKYKENYNALSGFMETGHYYKEVHACGYNPGSPIEIPKDRIVCSNAKLEVVEAAE